LGLNIVATKIIFQYEKENRIFSKVLQYSSARSRRILYLILGLHDVESGLFRAGIAMNTTGGDNCEKAHCSSRRASNGHYSKSTSNK
jgi:hypothetical protein